MKSFTTIYRAAVMVATAVIVVKGWQLYGPSTERMKDFAVATIEAAQTAWSKPHEESSEDAAIAGDPRVASPPLVAAAPKMQPDAPSPDSAPGLFVSNDSNNESTTAAADPAKAHNAVPLSPGDGVAGAMTETVDELPELFSQLTAMGASDQQLTAWGSSGRLYRFCCRARLGDSPFLSRHFEAVAEQPVAAVEQVVAQLKAWRDSEAAQTAMR
jgi:hypothetical protein